MYKFLPYYDSNSSNVVPAIEHRSKINRGDIVSMAIDQKTDFYIEVIEEYCDLLRGELIAIGPLPVTTYLQWRLGDKVQCSIAQVVTIVIQKSHS